MMSNLIEEGRFNEALESLTDLSDEDVRYNRLICLCGLGEYDKAKIEGKDALDKASKTYYDVVGIYVSILKELQEYEEAIDILVKELSMPYIPYNYESTYNAAYDELLLEKQELNKEYEYKDKVFKEEDIESVLERDDVKKEVLLMVIDQMSSMNIRRLIPSIRNFLADKSKDGIIKSVMIELMIDQEIDEEFVVNKNNNEYEVNPSYAPMVINSEVADSITSYLQRSLEDDNPSLLEMCIEFLQYYLYEIYPAYIDENEYKVIAAAVHYYMAALQSIDIELDALEEMYDCDRNQVLDKLQTLENVEY